MKAGFLLLLLGVSITGIFGRSLQDDGIKSKLDSLLSNLDDLENDLQDLASEKQEVSDSPPLDENQVDVNNGVKSDLRSSEFNVDGDEDETYEKRGASKRYNKWTDTNNDEKIEIPYILDNELPSLHVTRIKKAIAYINSLTCASGPKWVLRSNAGDSSNHYVKFVRQDGCWSYLGRAGDGSCNRCQRISIGDGCEYKGIISHEMLHAMGFHHEQNRPDRDDYIRVNFNNIASGLENNFEKIAKTDFADQGVDYDYLSVMHYGAKDFSNNGKAVITKRDGSTTGLGQRNGLTASDTLELNRFYNCPDTTEAPPPSPLSSTEAPPSPPSSTEAPTSPPSSTGAPPTGGVLREIHFNKGETGVRRSNFKISDDCKDDIPKRWCDSLQNKYTCAKIETFCKVTCEACYSNRYAELKDNASDGLIQIFYTLSSEEQQCDTRTYCMMLDAKHKDQASVVEVYGKTKVGKTWMENLEGRHSVSTIGDNWAFEYYDITLPCKRNTRFYISAETGAAPFSVDFIQIYDSPCSDIGDNRRRK